MPDSSSLTPQDKEITRVTDKFINSLHDVEGVILKQIKKIILELNSKDGKIILKDAFNKKLAMRMESLLTEAISKTKYDAEISKLMSNLDLVEQNAVEVQKEFGDLKVDLDKVKLEPIRQWAIDNAIYSLKEGGFKYNVIQPLKESLTRVVILGGSLNDLEAEVTAKTKGSLGNYAGGVVRDLFSQYEGAVQKKIEVAYDLNAILYVGGLKTTSRWQCKRWVGMGVILKKNLQKEIDLAFEKGSGMISETTPDTFTIYRGGWGCNHKAIPTMR